MPEVFMSCCRNSTKSIKQFSTLELLCEYKDGDDEPLSLDGVVIKSQMRGRYNNLVSDLKTQVLSVDDGVFLMTSDAKELPVGELLIDIIFEKDGKRVQSDTLRIDVEPSITIP